MQVASRIRQYKEELLVCCVKFLLALPVRLSTPEVVSPALHAALVTGIHSSINPAMMHYSRNKLTAFL